MVNKKLTSKQKPPPNDTISLKTVENGTDAIETLPVFKPHLVITDLRMEDMDGIALLKKIQKYNSILPVIMLSGSAEISDAVRATRQGIFKSIISLIGTTKIDTEFAPEIIHQSAIITNLLNQAQRVARTRSSVFIGGYTGTGKELLARAIHRSSHRSNKVFMAINCGALSEQLLESELFGHEKGLCKSSYYEC